jgi:hypothetical protein
LGQWVTWKDLAEEVVEEAAEAMATMAVMIMAVTDMFYLTLEVITQPEGIQHTVVLDCDVARVDSG